jgi:site-specific DNA-methyltransferase (adenine-specific)/adenine-specific DNA-methyltransferase
VFGDNLQFLKTVYENTDHLIKEKVKGKVKLIYIDPPFATGNEFKSSTGVKAYSDKNKGAEFIEFIRRRLILAKEILADDGSIFVHLDAKMAHYIKIVLDEVFGKNNFRNEVIWQYRSGGISKSEFAHKHDTIYWYSKSSNYYFLPQKENVKKTVEGKEVFTDNKGEFVWHTHPSIKNPKGIKSYLDGYMTDVWDIPIINTQALERTGYPTQKPEKLLERIIRCSTKDGDIVLDFFGGSGTTACVAEKLNRKWITCDIGEYSYYTIQKRWLEISDSKIGPTIYGKKARSFITAQLGSYDLEIAS